ncbi:MAG: rhodanese-like domain-containing protein [Mucilaginibacter sp.]
MNNISELLVIEDITIVDVRTPAEFMSGHLDKSINLPLSDLQDRLNEVRSMSNVILCCASGIRSNKATTFLKQNGIECQDGGSWMDLKNRIKTNKQ